MTDNQDKIATDPNKVDAIKLSLMLTDLRLPMISKAQVNALAAGDAWIDQGANPRNKPDHARHCRPAQRRSTLHHDKPPSVLDPKYVQL